MLTILTLKPIIERNGEKIIDLTYPSIRYNYSPRVESVVSITEQMEMRPDLLSRAAYGSTEQWDIILKYNARSNPFAISVDDIFLIPSLDDMNEQLATSGNDNTIADVIRKQYIDVSKKAQVDPKLASLEQKRKDAQRKAVEGVGVQSVSNLPPNISENGDNEIVIKGGLVYFGPNISKNKQQSDQPLTKSDYIANLIKNTLNK